MPFVQTTDLRRNGMHALLGLALLLFVLVASGCGKPAYCSDVETLRTSVQDLPGKATAGGMSALEAQLTTIENDAKTVEESAKSDFPNETSALTNTIDQLQTSIKELPDKPSTVDYATIALNATAVVSAVQQFNSATASKCK